MFELAVADDDLAVVVEREVFERGFAADDDDDVDNDSVFHDEYEHTQGASPTTAWPSYSIAVIDAVYRFVKEKHTERNYN